MTPRTLTSAAYRAPALEKGLDIIELLADAETPLTLAELASRLGRNHTEIFRMVQVLESRGFLLREPTGDGYVITDHLFSLAIRRPVIQTLFETALPIMQELSADTGHSCHLAVHSRGDMVVVARMESSEQLGFAVRVGYRQPIIRTTSGAVLYAFQSDATRRRWEEVMVPKPSQAALNSFKRHAEEVRTRGGDEQPSGFVEGVIDLSAPILRGDAAAAALTIPFLKQLHPRLDLPEVRLKLRAASQAISRQLFAQDNRA